MIKYFTLTLLFGAALAGPLPSVDINKDVDEVLHHINLNIRREKGRLIPIHSYNFEDANVRHGEGFFVGADSLRRTGNCTRTLTKSGLKFDIHIGFGLLVSAFGDISFKGQAMSGYYQVRDNSAHIVARVMPHSQQGYKKKCNLYIDTAEIEKLDNVTLHSSVKEYDNLDVSEFYRESVLPAINKLIKKQLSHIGDKWPGVCTKPDLQKQSSELISMFLQ